MSGGEKKNDGNGGGEKKNNGNGGGEKKNDGNGGGEKKNDGNAGGEKKNDGNGGGEKKNDGNGGGWMSTFFKVAGAAAAATAVATVVAGGLYIAMKQPEAEQVALGSSSNRKQPGKQQGKQPEEEEEISVWTKPRIGWVKLNVDGSLLPHSAGCGGVLRDSSGKWISGFAQKLDPTSRVDQTEKEAILRGLQCAESADKRLGLGVRKLAVESDNEGVVYMVNHGPNNTNDRLICEIRKLLFRGRYEQATLTSIPRKANQVADKLANMSHGFSSFDLKVFDSAPLP